MIYRDIKKAAYILRNQGLRALIQRAANADRSARNIKQLDYERWINLNEPIGKFANGDFTSDGSINAELTEDMIDLRKRVKISFLCPVFNPKIGHLEDLVGSFLSQGYSDWELCLADGGSDYSIRRRLKQFSKDDDRISVTFLDDNKGIAMNTAAAAERASGDYFAFIDHDDKIARGACFEIARAIQNTGADFLYSDEDKFDDLGRFDPHFKPDWSPDTLQSYNYITHLMIMSRELFFKAGGFREGFDGSQDHDLALRATALAEKIVHVPKILYHWRSHAGSVAGDGMSKPYAFEAGRKAVSAHVKKNGDGLGAEHGMFPASYRAHFAFDPDAKISIIIPNKDNPDMLRSCVNSIFDTANGADFEIIIVENGSKEQQTFDLYDQLVKDNRVKIHTMQGGFNYSAANNLGARNSSGELLLFLNNDIRAIEMGWLQAMMEHALREKIGAVGAKLLFEDGKIQHAGVVVGMCGWADHVCAGGDESGQGMIMGSHIVNTVRNVSAVTGACMMISRDKFEQVLGFNEEFTLCGSDVEICLRLLALGYNNIYTPFARLEHRESATRAKVDIPPEDFIKSAEAYRYMWQNGDPYYSIHWDYDSKFPRIRTAEENLQGRMSH